MVFARKEQTMGYWRYQEDSQRRRAIIAEFFTAYEAARRASPAFASAPASNPANLSTQVPACLRVLGLAFPCTTPEVKHAFRVQAKVVHPDSGGSSEAFQTLYQAYKDALALVK